MAGDAGSSDWRSAHAGGVERSGQFGLWLESDIPHLFKVVTPVTAALLRWWFGEEACMARAEHFYADERQAILDAIVAHELLGTAKLFDVYRATASDAKAPTGGRSVQCCLKLRSEASRERVVQALLVWQLLNRSVALARGEHDPRFTHRFLIAAAGVAACDEWRAVLRDMLMVHKCEVLLVPPPYRQEVHGFLREAVCRQDALDTGQNRASLIAVVDGHAAWENASSALRSWPDLMVFDATPVQGSGRAAWMQLLPHMALSRRHRFMQVGLLVAHDDEASEQRPHFRMRSASL